MQTRLDFCIYAFLSHTQSCPSCSHVAQILSLCLSLALEGRRKSTPFSCSFGDKIAVPVSFLNLIEINTTPRHGTLACLTDRFVSVSWTDSDLDWQARFLAVKENTFCSYRNVQHLSKKHIVYSRELDRNADTGGSKISQVMKGYFRAVWTADALY